MDMEEQQQQQHAAAPHVLVFPYPAQGHVTPMLTLSQLLCHAGIHVTFLSTEHNHRRLSQRTALSARFPNLHFESIPDGLPPDHPRTIYSMNEMVSALKSVTKPLLRELLISLTTKNKDDDDKSNESSTRDRRPRLGCVITDGIMCFAIDVAEELGIPTMAMRFISACAFWVYCCIPDLIQHAQLPFADEDMDKSIRHVPGMESFLRRRDLPSFCRMPIDDPILKFVIEETQASSRASAAFILNTFEDLEASVLSHIALRFPKFYTIGPLHALLKSRVGDDLSSSSSAASLWKEDRHCMAWLDSRPFGSVIFVSFGSLVMVTRGQLLEFWHGLVNSGKYFLWVVRPDILWDKEGTKEQVIPVELEMGTKERGLIVEWAPQVEVLDHESVGGFLTHSGWNSTQESIWAGVPMLCWPQIADQQVNSRWVSEVWKMGLDMKDTCDRSTVEKMVRALMEESNQREQKSKSVDRFSKLARQAVSEGGSSYNNLDKLIQDLKTL